MTSSLEVPIGQVVVATVHDHLATAPASLGWLYRKKLGAVGFSYDTHELISWSGIQSSFAMT